MTTASNPAASSPAESILIVDAGHGVGPALAALLAGRGFDVVAWSPSGEAQPEAAGSVRWLHEPTADTLDADLLGPVRAAVFNASPLDEAALLAGGGLADAVAADGAFFMQALQAVSRAMIEKGRGQIWALAPDDSFAYYLPLPVAPVAHHMRVGAVRALAKELSRFGVFANAAILQPGPETAEPAAWQAARAGVGSYAQKFRPVPLAAVAETLAFWLGCGTLPLNGSVVHFGNGVYDGNF